MQATPTLVPNDFIDTLALGLARKPSSIQAPAIATMTFSVEQLRYTLAKQVPDMACGFTISTGYGAITFPPGGMAERIQSHVEQVLQAELLTCAPDAWA